MPAMAEPALSFAGLLRQLRADARLTQEELAEAAALSSRSISDLERGINRTARKDTAGLLADALGLAGPVRELFVAAARGKVPAAEVLSARLPWASTVMDALAGAGGVAGIRAFLFTDIEGSTALLQRLGREVYAGALADHHGLIRSALASHGGQELNTAGDAFFAGFATPRACLAAALAMQQALESHGWPGGERLRVRMGVHAGEAEQTAAGLVGLDVHRAARISAVAHGGQVLVSESAAALVRDGLPPGTALKDLGMHRLKDLGRPERLFQLCGPGLAAQFPPPRSLGNPALPNNLPAQLTVFVGRKEELSAVRALAASSRLVTLTGPGGCGKTRLGLQVAGQMLDGPGDGVWLVELAAVTDESAVAAAVADALRIPAQPGRPVLDVVADALGAQDLLIVLDNCEHLIGGCAKTADALLRGCPKVRLLATSREPLGIAGETIYRVPPLSLPGPGASAPSLASFDAVALFAARARTQAVDLPLDGQTGSLVVSVCRQLDGMPLAIELAAARLRSMSLAELAGRLDQRFGLLTGGSRTALARQQTLLATVGWSYSLLTAAERVLLGRLSVFAGSFDLPAAEAVCGFGAADAVDVVGLLGSLVDKSLVVTEPAGADVRYRLLETIRLFAAERLADAGSEETAAARAAHCMHYLAVAEGAAAHLFGAEQGSWFDRLEADHTNLRRAAEHAAGQPDGTAQVLRFAVALWRYWSARYRMEEAAALVLPVLARPEAAADPALLAEALVAASHCARFTDVSRAIQLAHHADHLARELGDNRLLVLTCHALCGYYGQAAEWERACRLGQEAVQRARELGDDVLLGMSLVAYGSAVDAPNAGPLYAEAIACTERSGDLFTILAVHNEAGFRGMQMGDIPGARAHLEAALRAADAVGVLHLVALGNLADVLRAEGDLDDARSGFEDVVRMSRRIGDKWSLAGATLGLGFLAADVGDWHRAAVLHGVTHALLDQISAVMAPSDEWRCQDSLDQARAALGDEQVQQAYAHGTALSFDGAIEFALDQSSQQQTLRAAVGRSYSLLTPAEQVLLGRLSVFAGSFDLPAAEAVCGYATIDPDEIAVLLGSLVDKSLVVAEPTGASTRYRLLETILLFAAERLADADGEATVAARAAHCGHYLALAETAAPHLTGPEQGRWFDRLEADLANLRRAAQHASAQPDGTSRVLRFSIALERYLGIRPESRRLWAGLPLLAALERPDAAADPALYAGALLVASSTWGFGDLIAACRFAQQAADVAAGIGDDRLLAEAQGWLSQHYRNTGEPERAQALGQEAVARARNLGDDVLLGGSLLAYGPAVAPADAGPLYAEAIACTDRSGDLYMKSLAHMLAGGAALENGDIPGARAHVAKSIRAADAIGDPHLSASTALGDVLLAEHDYDGAWSAYIEVVRRSRRIGNPADIAFAVLGLADLAAHVDDWHRAATLHGIAQAMAGQIQMRDPSNERRREQGLGQARAALGDEQVQQAYAHGMALSFDDAMEFAIDKSSAH
jgi:predicted ATPase/class 3 adenylate cyclase